MSDPNTPLNESQLLSESESFSSPEEQQTSDSPEHSINVDKSTSKTVEKTHNKPNPEFLKNTDWYAVACKIRQNNRQLVQKILDLEHSLQGYAEKLEIQQRRCRSADNLIEQQTQELNNSQREIEQLYHQLEKLNHQSQNQQILTENLSQQLRTSQEQIARLERECSGLQDSYNQEKQKSLELEKYNRELEVRLQRQQHYTLQFKAALDQCLQAPSEENVQEILDKQVSIKVKEIQPWSNYQAENEQIKINSALHKKLLAHQMRDESQSLMSDSPLEEIEKETDTNNTNILETPVLDQQEDSNLDKIENIDSSVKDNSVDDLDLPLENDNDNDVDDSPLELENNLDQPDKEKKVDINLPLVNEESKKSKESITLPPESESASIFLDLDISNSSEKNRKKASLKLPKLE